MDIHNYDDGRNGQFAYIRELLSIGFYFMPILPWWLLIGRTPGNSRVFYNCFGCNLSPRLQF